MKGVLGERMKGNKKTRDSVGRKERDDAGRNTKGMGVEGKWGREEGMKEWVLEEEMLRLVGMGEGS